LEIWNCELRLFPSKTASSPKSKSNSRVLMTLGVIRAIRTQKVFSIFVSVAMIKPVLRDLTDYFEVALSSPQVQIQMVPKGSGLQHIHLEDLREDCIPLPPITEQARIVATTSRQLSIIDSLEQEIEKRFFQSGALRRSVLHTAFSGKLVPQDPNDEPASVLLERIRAERARAQEQKQKTPKATNGASRQEIQRRRRVAKLAQGVSHGKG
jgi:type I restriction enzyme S subunit